MAVSSKSGNTKLVADALQRELSYAGVRFAATFDLDGAAAESAHSEGVKGAENVEGAEGDEAVENGKAPTPLHRRLLRKRVGPTWYSSAFGATRAHAAPLFSIFFRALWESAFFCSAPAASVKATSISRKFSREFAHICLPMRSILAARCVKARWVWA